MARCPPPAYPALMLLVATAAIMQPRLLSIPFLLIVLRQATPLALAAIGQSMPMIGRSIDLSIGGIMALSNVILAMPFMAKGPAWWVDTGAVGDWRPGRSGQCHSRGGHTRVGSGGDARHVDHPDRHQLYRERWRAGRPGQCDRPFLRGRPPRHVSGRPVSY